MQETFDMETLEDLERVVFRNYLQNTKKIDSQESGPVVTNKTNNIGYQNTCIMRRLIA